MNEVIQTLIQNLSAQRKAAYEKMTLAANEYNNIEEALAKLENREPDMLTEASWPLTDIAEVIVTPNLVSMSNQADTVMNHSEPVVATPPVVKVDKPRRKLNKGPMDRGMIGRIVALLETADAPLSTMDVTRLLMPGGSLKQWNEKSGSVSSMLGQYTQKFGQPLERTGDRTTGFLYFIRGRQFDNKLINEKPNEKLLTANPTTEVRYISGKLNKGAKRFKNILGYVREALKVAVRPLNVDDIVSGILKQQPVRSNKHKQLLRTSVASMLEQYCKGATPLFERIKEHGRWYYVNKDTVSTTGE